MPTREEIARLLRARKLGGADNDEWALADAILALPSPAPVGEAAYQARVGAWMDDVFASGGADLRTRIDRYLEESFELAQALDYDPGRIAAIRDYVFGRPVGEPRQETGGVMVTLASLCHAAEIDLMVEAECELARVRTPAVRAKIMAKQASKNALHTPLPTAEAAQQTSAAEAREPVNPDDLVWVNDLHDGEAEAREEGR